MNCEPTRVAWTWRHAVCASDLAPTTRHVLLTLSMFMNELGESCHPSTTDLCRYSGLDKKTVLKHVAAAREAGWIDVSQHGYRGQRWKRQEYAARWPERDLIAPCAPDAGHEGGGAVPPPTTGEKVVERVREGGGTEGSKVVEHVHQDKTSPDNIPNTSPVERERGREPEDRKAVEKAFERAWQAWPTSVSDSRPAALKAWMGLQSDERAAASDEMARWLEANKASGRKHVPAFGSYLADKRWENLPPRQEAEAPSVVDGKPFGPWWMAERLKKLLAGPTMQPAGLTMFERSMVENGKASADELMRQKIAKSGFPIINAMHDRAVSRQGVTVSVTLKPLTDLMEAVPVGCERYVEWRVEHELRGWPWLPDPGDQPVVFFPAGGPGALDAFVAKINEGAKDDGDRREAAE